MSEEKKAIEYLTKYINWETYGERSLEKDIRTVLNLIKKQQEEIEELQKDKKVLVENYDKVLGTFISKDKIREKIEELEKEQDYKIGLEEYTIRVLNELLEEK